jgi:2-keto-4-pentenoate hydratase
VPGETATDPRAVDVSMESVQVRKNARLVEAGTGAQVLGHPATAVSWLAEILSEQGASVPAGQVVSTGSLTTAIPVEPGDVIEARFGTLGTVSVAFE